MPGAEPFAPGAGAVAGTIICEIAEPCGVLEDVVVVGTGLAIAGIEAWHIYKLAKETGTPIDAYNELLRDFKNCTDAYPPGPDRERCFEAARQKFRIRTGKPIPGPQQ
jgi:hypothetical protein